MKFHTRLCMFGKLYVQTILCTLCFFKTASAQSLLNKRISVSFSHERLADVLQKISKEGEFYFSYNGNILSKDSLVTIAANNQTIYSLLQQLFQGKCQFNEERNYIIITPVSLMHLSFINVDLTSDKNTYSVSGFVIDGQTGERLMNASLYEKQQLVSALTDEHGYFRLKFTTSHPGSINITASKRLYSDTTIRFLQPVLVSSRDNAEEYEGVNNDGNRIERTRLGHMFISTRQKIQSLNIPNFFATRPFQVSLTPGLSSHGMFSSQVVNRFSLNLAGGYTAGVSGLEAGGLFNINRRDARYVQLAGVFNLVGGTVTGLQAAGVHNRAMDTVRGVQMAGFINIAEGQVSGVQFSALHNQARKLKGIQVGLVNKADTSQGASIGLINIIGNGFYKLTVSAGSITNTNISLKTGTHPFYSSLLTGMNISSNNKMYYFGLGIGHDIMLSSKVYLSAEAGYRFAYTGLWDDRWADVKLLLNAQLIRNISLVAGPTYNKYTYTGSQPGYQSKFRKPDRYSTATSNPVKKWVGWESGIAYNAVFVPVKKTVDTSQAWYIGIATSGGIGWDPVYQLACGAELFVQRDLGEHLSASLSAGYTYFALNHASTNVQDYINVNGQSVHWSYQPYKLIPVKAGVRLQTGRHLYIGGELGAAWSLPAYYLARNSSSSSVSYTLQHLSRCTFIYAFSGGFVFSNGLDAGVKFEDYGIQTNYKQFALRLAYRIRLSRQ